MRHTFVYYTRVQSAGTELGRLSPTYVDQQRPQQRLAIDAVRLRISVLPLRGQAACRTRARRSSKPARPYIVPLYHLDPADLAFGRTGRLRQIECGLRSGDIRAQASDEVGKRRRPARRRVLHHSAAAALDCPTRSAAAPATPRRRPRPARASGHHAASARPCRPASSGPDSELSGCRDAGQPLTSLAPVCQARSDAAEQIVHAKWL